MAKIAIAFALYLRDLSINSVKGPALAGGER
jgi:hypothetical protein